MPIPKARLEALPSTYHCILCVTELEVHATHPPSSIYEHLHEALKMAEDLTGATEIGEVTPEQAADNRANDMLCRQIERIEGLDET